MCGGRGASRRACQSASLSKHPVSQGLHPAAVSSVSCTTCHWCLPHLACLPGAALPSPAGSVTHSSAFSPTPLKILPPSLPTPPSRTFPAAPVCRQAWAVLAGAVKAVCAAQDCQPLRVIRQLQWPLDVQLYQLQGGGGRAGRAGEVRNNKKLVTAAAVAVGHRMTALRQHDMQGVFVSCYKLGVLAVFRRARCSSHPDSVKQPHVIQTPAANTPTRHCAHPTHTYLQEVPVWQALVKSQEPRHLWLRPTAATTTTVTSSSSGRSWRSRHAR